MAETTRMNLEQILSAPEENLAIGVLRQAVYDLRRYRDATAGLEREIYLDAFRWIGATDFSWPYSFANICQLLDVPAEMLRAELLDNATLTPFRYWWKVGTRFGRSFRGCLSRTFKGSRNGYPGPITPQLKHS
jgi:hypothetical protein